MHVLDDDLCRVVGADRACLIDTQPLFGGADSLLSQAVYRVDAVLDRDDKVHVVLLGLALAALEAVRDAVQHLKVADGLVGHTGGAVAGQ